MIEDKLIKKKKKNYWRAYKQTKNQEIRNVLVKKYAPLVKYVAGKIAINMPNNVEFDDLVGYGIFGLFDAIEKYDLDKHVKFKTYAVTRIRGSIFDELRSIDWIPRSIRQKTREIDNVVKKIETNNGRNATNEEVAEELGISLKED